MFDHVLYVGDMTSLRYAIPFIKASKRLLSIDVKLAYNTSVSSGKYNDIQKSLKRYSEIIEENQITSIDISKSRFETETLICIENVHGGIAHKKLFSIQHGFDWTGLHKNSRNSVYLVTESFFKEQLENLGHHAIVMPIPVVFWDWDYYWKNFKNQDDHVRSVTLFYPEQGFHDEFKKVYNNLEKLGYKTYIKQRSKNQVVPADLRETFYDSIWYPTESIQLPMLSDIIVGFGTSAYTDLVHINRRFFDFCLPDYSSSYYKPNTPNFFRMSSNFDNALEVFCKQAVDQSIILDKRSNPCDDLLIESFLKRVLQ